MAPVSQTVAKAVEPLVCAVVVLDGQGRIAALNDAAERLVQQSGEPPIGQPCRILPGALSTVIEETFRHGPIHQRQLVIGDATSPRVMLEASTLLWRDAN